MLGRPKLGWAPIPRPKPTRLLGLDSPVLRCAPIQQARAPREQEDGGEEMYGMNVKRVKGRILKGTVRSGERWMGTCK